MRGRMVRRCYCFFGFVVVLFSFLALSSCVVACEEEEEDALVIISEEIKRKISQGIYLNFDLTGLRPVCKRWPSQTMRSIVVSPYSYSKSDGEEVYLGAVIAVVDKAAGKVEVSIDDEKISVIDGVYPTSIYIDTARYEISPGEVSFGVRFSQRAMSSVAQFQETFVNLYLVSHGAVVSIGRGVKTSSYNGEGDGNCVFEGVEMDATIAVSDFSTNGKKDLVVTTKSKNLSSALKSGECVSSRSVAGVVREVLKFNGDQYEIPNGVKSSLAL